MPYRRRRRKRRFKRRRKRRYGYNPFGKTLLGNKHACKLRYHDFISLDPAAAGIPAVHVFSCNGIYDTDITGTGHQPRGFDEISALYDHYTVVGAKLTATFTVNTLAADVICGIAQKDDAVVYTAINNYMESRNVKSRGLIVGQGPLVTLISKASPKKFLGRPGILTEDNLRGSISANPAEQMYFHIFAGPLTTDNVGTMDVSIVIDFLVVFTEPRNPGQS